MVSCYGSQSRPRQSLEYVIFKFYQTFKSCLKKRLPEKHDCNALKSHCKKKEYLVYLEPGIILDAFLKCI